MFAKKWKSDIYNRIIHIEGKEDRIEGNYSEPPLFKDEIRVT